MVFLAALVSIDVFALFILVVSVFRKMLICALAHFWAALNVRWQCLGRRNRISKRMPSLFINLSIRQL
jgi:hypothetical protein